MKLERNAKIIGVFAAILVALLILSSGSINASTITSIRSGIFSPINTPVFSPSENGYGYQTDGTLTVIKQVVGGPLGASNFTLSVYNDTPTGSDVLLKSFKGSSSGVQVFLLGAYDVDEANYPNYTAVFTGDCYGTLSSGQSAICTVTNTYKASSTGHLKVIKDVIGGPNSPYDFTLHVYSDTKSNHDKLVDSFPGSSTGVIVAITGKYDVAEVLDTTSVKYNASYSAGCYGTLSPGENATCIITNTFKGRGVLNVIKKVVGGPLGASNFTLSVYNDSKSNHDLLLTSFQGSSTGVPVSVLGKYDVKELAYANYSTSFSGGCYGTLSVGQNATCIVTNTYIKPKAQLTVITKVEGGGQNDAHDFTMHVYNYTGSKSNLFDSFPGSTPGVKVTLTGKYYVSEVLDNTSIKYTQSYSSGCYGTLSSGQSAICTVTNTYKKTKS